MYHFNSTEIIQSCSHFRALNLSYASPSLSYQVAHSFLHESSEAFESEVTCTTTRHRNNVPRLRGEEHDTSLKIETARQAAPCPSPHKMFKILFRLLLFTLVVDQLIRPIGLLIKSSVYRPKQLRQCDRNNIYKKNSPVTSILQVFVIKKIIMKCYLDSYFLFWL